MKPVEKSGWKILSPPVDISKNPGSLPFRYRRMVSNKKLGIIWGVQYSNDGKSWIQGDMMISKTGFQPLGKE